MDNVNPLLDAEVIRWLLCGRFWCPVVVFSYLMVIEQGVSGIEMFHVKHSCSWICRFIKKLSGRRLSICRQQRSGSVTSFFMFHVKHFLSCFTWSGNG